MRFESSFDEVEPPRIRTFNYTAQHRSITQSASIDVEIPLSENQSIDELITHVIVANKILHPFRQEFERAFRKFVDDETKKYEDEVGDAAIEELLRSDDDAADVAKWVRTFSPPSSQQSSNDVSFSEQFQFVMRNSSYERIEMIISLERKMADEMCSVVRARDFDLERMMRHCEDAMCGGNAENAESNAQELSRMNERIRQVSNNYACQIQALADRQRFEYRNLITSLYERDEFPPEVFNDVPCIASTVRKSTSAFANLNSVKSASGDRLEESFTIYLGAQLKTMHNARLLTCRRLVDVCRPLDALEPGALDTRRLHMNLSLYRRGLNALVLLVSKDPFYHTHSATEFAKFCEQSTELHFDSLQRQLENGLQSIREASRDRSSRESGAREESSLQVGDVYLTRHSNLSSVQVIFHLVVDDSLSSEEISSRHPCINGLRNVVRLCSKCGITTFTIPLLLVESISKNMTVAWCLKRAELVFKCVKGFMMEVCASCSDAGPPTSATHYNVNFVLPQQLAGNVYTQIVEMFPTIFHLVPSVSL